MFPKGYVYNIQIYQGKQSKEPNNTKLEALVFILMKPFINKGHHFRMDSYYNRASLCEKCLEKTLQKHCSLIIKIIQKSEKLKKGELIWF